MNRHWMRSNENSGKLTLVKFQIRRKLDSEIQ